MRAQTEVTVGSAATRIVVSAETSAGAVRPLNEDSFRAAPPLFVVADGMGGHERGDVASRTAIAAIADRVPEGSTPTVDELLAAIGAANDAVRERSERDGVTGVSGTTLVVLGLVRGDSEGSAYWLAANIGDFQTSTDPNVQRFLGLEVEGEDGAAVLDPGLGLPTDFAAQVVTQVGNYGEIFDEHLTPLGLERGVNALWTDGGLMYAPPYR